MTSTCDLIPDPDPDVSQGTSYTTYVCERAYTIPQVVTPVFWSGAGRVMGCDLDFLFWYVRHRVCRLFISREGIIQFFLVRILDYGYRLFRRRWRRVTSTSRLLRWARAGTGPRGVISDPALIHPGHWCVSRTSARLMTGSAARSLPARYRKGRRIRRRRGDVINSTSTNLLTGQALSEPSSLCVRVMDHAKLSSHTPSPPSSRRIPISPHSTCPEHYRSPPTNTLPAGSILPW